MSPSLLDVLSIASSAARIARRSAAIQTAQWTHRSRITHPDSVENSAPPDAPGTLPLPDGHDGDDGRMSSSAGAPLPSKATSADSCAPSNGPSPKLAAPHGPASDHLRTHDRAQQSPDVNVGRIKTDPELEGNNSSTLDAVRVKHSSVANQLEPATSNAINYPLSSQSPSPSVVPSEEPRVVLKASKVPSSRLARLFHYGGLAAGLGFGAASEYVRRSSRHGEAGSLLLSEANVSRLVDKLSRMRGAALKLGQFLSIQDAHVLPPQLESVFQQLQNKANYMPNWQMEQVLMAELGANWRTHFEEFDPIPIASASIGQVHRARLAQHHTDVAVKIQFPSVAQSISSDLSNLSLLLTTSSLLPRGLFLQNTIHAMQQELADECDYEREAHFMELFASNLREDKLFSVPRVVKGLTTKRVLVMEWMEGVPLTRAVHFDQPVKNEIASRILRLCLRELFEFSMMQTDPNWTNFLWNTNTQKIELIDFGATRQYSKIFIDQWLRLLRAAIDNNRPECLDASREVGYLTGDENNEMVDAHVESMFLLASPFRESSGQPYHFSGQTITTQVKALIPVMLRHRLTPPPRETYSLNRMLSGAFLLCARLDAEVACSEIWHETTDYYQYVTTAVE